jgi:DNA-binding response OmpR family regulator
MDKKILIVDDERDICEILAFNLANEGYDVETANSAEEALDKLTDDYSLILLDVMMGGMSGYHLAEKLRKGGNDIPIIFLTAKDMENDMLTGFAVGGDDYISKPFSLQEVSARIKAVLKRAPQHTEEHDGDIIATDGIRIDLLAKELTIGGNPIPLTRTEFELLALLASNPSRMFSRYDIIDRIRKDAPYITERTIDVHITRLRKKLGDKSSLIMSKVGYGYKFNTEQS